MSILPPLPYNNIDDDNCVQSYLVFGPAKVCLMHEKFPNILDRKSDRHLESIIGMHESEIRCHFRTRGFPIIQMNRGIAMHYGLLTRITSTERVMREGIASVGKLGDRRIVAALDIVRMRVSQGATCDMQDEIIAVAARRALWRRPRACTTVFANENGALRTTSNSTRHTHALSLNHKRYLEFILAQSAYHHSSNIQA